MKLARVSPQLLVVAGIVGLALGALTGCGGAGGEPNLPAAGGPSRQPEEPGLGGPVKPSPLTEQLASMDFAMGATEPLDPGIPIRRDLPHGEFQLFTVEPEWVRYQVITCAAATSQSDVDLYVLSMDPANPTDTMQFVGTSARHATLPDWVAIRYGSVPDGHSIFAGVYAYAELEGEDNEYLLEYDVSTRLPEVDPPAEGSSMSWKDYVWHHFSVKPGRYYQVVLKQTQGVSDAYVYSKNSEGCVGWTAEEPGGGSVRFWAGEKKDIFVRIASLTDPADFACHYHKRSRTPTATPPAGVDRVLLVAWDGCQRRHLKQALKRGKLPHLQSLVATGSLVNADVRNHPTGTKAGFAEILTGYPPSVTRVCHGSEFKGTIPEGFTLFERVEAHYAAQGRDITTCFVSGKNPKFLGGSTPGELWFFAYNHINVWLGDRSRHTYEGGPLMTDFLARHGAAGPFFAFFHFREPDNTGHSYGEDSLEYETAIIECDDWLGTMVQKLEELGVRDQTRIFVCTDHGFREGERHHRRAPGAWLVSDRPDVTRNGGLEDIAPTIYQAMGIPTADFEPPLAGHPLM